VQVVSPTPQLESDELAQYAAPQQLFPVQASPIAPQVSQ